MAKRSKKSKAARRARATSGSATYDVIIVGGGVTGTAALFVLTWFTNVRRILFIERRQAVGLVNSNRVNNSQTLHMGPIESNYTLMQALKVHAGAELLEGYIRTLAPHAAMEIHKLLIGVGERECGIVSDRFSEFKPSFPEIEFLDRERIAETEPSVILGRDPAEKICALMEPKGFAADYMRVAESFVMQARKTDVTIDFVFHEQVDRIEKREGGHVVHFGDDSAFAPAVIVAAGSPSLVFAHSLGYGEEFAMLPVAGSFMLTRILEMLGKVYTVQNNKIPFAALHADPAVYDPREVRFGPTAKPMPLLERGSWPTFFEFMRTHTATPRGLIAALKVAADWDITRFLLKNAAYELPLIGERVFLSDARKICPSLKPGDLELDRGAGGIRGQLIDKNAGRIARGKDKLVGDGIIFIMAPSPGASFCLGNAVEDAHTIGGFLGSGFRFDEANMRRTLGLSSGPRQPVIQA